MKRVMLTGGTGFIGANMARRLLQDGNEVHLLVRSNEASWRMEAIRRDVKMHALDLADAPAVERVVDQIRPDWVFHLAVHGAYSWQNDLDQMVKTNVIGTANLVRACLKTGFEAFVNTGSSSEYGFKDHAVAETEVLEPNSYYAVTKAWTTLFCRHVAQRHRLHMPTLRLYSVYGPYEEPRRLMPSLILKGLEHKLPPLVNPDIKHDFVYIEDVERAYLLAASRPNQEAGTVYNVGSGYQTSIRAVVEAACRIMSIPAKPDWGSMPDRQWDTSIWVADIRKIRNELGWEPQVSLEQGFTRMIEWFGNDSSSPLRRNGITHK